MHETTTYTKDNTYEKNVKIVKELIHETKSKTLLDFGCGKGDQYTIEKSHMGWGGILPHLYDPAIEKYNKAPEGTFDGVLCIDVIEHVPEFLIEKTLNSIYSYAKKFVYFAIPTYKASLQLPNGENAHITLKERQWWSRAIEKANRDNLPTYILMVNLLPSNEVH